MDHESYPKGWEYLPVDLLMDILPYLPLRTVAKFRLVCKRLNEMWESPKFWELRSQKAPREKYALFIRNYAKRLPEVYLYDPMRNKLWSSPFNYFPSQKNHIVLASSGGLLFSVQFPICTEVYGECTGGCWPHRGCDMIVSNPLKKDCVRVLPTRVHSVGLPCVVGMICETDGYKVIMGNENYGTEVYDSRSQSWKFISRTNESTTPLPRVQNSSVISRKGSLLYVGYRFEAERGCYLQKVCLFKSTTETWSCFDLPSSEIWCHSIQMEDCGGKLFLVAHRKLASSEDEKFVCYASLRVWERLGEDPVFGFWEEQVASYPESYHFPKYNLNVAAEYLTVPIKSEDFLCFSRGVQWPVCSFQEEFQPISSFQEEFQQMSIYNPTLSSWWSTMDRVCDHSEYDVDDLIRRTRFAPLSEMFSTNFGGHFRYSADLIFEPRLEAVP